MIQTYNTISQEIQSFRNIFTDYAQIQKIYSSSQFISIQIRLPGKSFFLYLGRGHGFEGFWLGEKQVESALRKRDQFLEYLRRYLSASVLLGVDLDDKDRVLKISYGRFGQTNKLFLFYKGRELYFANYYFDEKDKRFKTFLSWHKGVQEEKYDDFNVFDSIGRKEIPDKTKVQKRIPIEKLLKNEKEKAQGLLSSGKSKKFLVRKKKNIDSDITKVSQWPKLVSFIEQTEDFAKLERKIAIHGFKLKFKSPEHYKRQDELYLKVKKLKKAQKILALRLSDTIDTLEKQKQRQENFENNLKTIKPIWAQSFKTEELVIKKEKGYVLHELKGLKLAIGQSAVANDQMRKEWAKKEDIWFHAVGDKSPHIIVKLGDQNLDMEFFKIIASMMVHYMGSDSREINLMYTSVKNLKGVKGAAGSVTFKKEKYINVIIEKNWNSIITDYQHGNRF